MKNFYNFLYVLLLLPLSLKSFPRKEPVYTAQNTTEYKFNKETCHFNEKKLYGKIQFVAFKVDADITVSIVNNFADLKVKFVENFPDQCGEWQVVEHHPDLKVYITENLADLKIQLVSNFPGIP